MASGYSGPLGLQSDDKLLAMMGLAITRYAPDGTPDPGFGTGGTATSDIGGTLAVQPDNKIVVAGGTGTSVVVARWNADGSLDTTFGTGGTGHATIPAPGVTDLRLGFQSDGSIVVAGTTPGADSGGDFLVARLTAAGSLDTSFGANGSLTTDVHGNSNDQAAALLVQADGKIVVGGSTGQAGTPASNDFALVRYVATSQPGSLQFRAATYSVREDGGQAVITVTRSGGSDGTVTVGYTSRDGTAMAGTNYTASSGTLTFNAGETSKTFTVPVLDDGFFTGDGTVNLALTNPGGGTTLGSQATAVLTIGEADLRPSGRFSFDATAYAVPENAGSATITVIRRNGALGAARVFYATSDGTARAGFNYVATSGSLTFNEFEDTKSFTVPILDDGLFDPDATVNLTLSDPTGGIALGQPRTAVLTIQEGDVTPPPGQVQFSPASYAAPESAGNVTLFLTRTGGSYGGITVPYVVTAPASLPAKNQATPGVDFQGPLAGTVTFQPGQMFQTLGFPVVADSLVEDTEYFTVTLQPTAGGAALGGPATATVAIVDTNLPAVPDAMPQLAVLQWAGAGFGKSEEHYRDFVTRAYARYLDRLPDENGLIYWTSLITLYETSGHSRGLRQEQVEAGFLDSPEYQGHFGGVGQAWIEGIYHDLLDREADTGGLRYWLAALQAGMSPTDVALGFTASLERLRNRVTDTYFTLLGRAPDRFGLDYWTAVFQQGGTTEDINSGFVGSIEYYNKAEGAGGNPAKWVCQAYLDILSRPARADELDYWLAFLNM